jgi:DNA-binding beta-propeller fold protein YncE
VHQGVEDDGRSLWVALYRAGLVVKVDRASGKVVKSYTVGELPRGLTIALGSMWVASSASGTVSRIGLNR